LALLIIAAYIGVQIVLSHIAVAVKKLESGAGKVILRQIGLLQIEVCSFPLFVSVFNIQLQLIEAVNLHHSAVMVFQPYLLFTVKLVPVHV